MNALLFISHSFETSLNLDSLSDKHTSSSNSLDLLFSRFTEKFGFDNHWLLGQSSFSENFVVTLIIKKLASKKVTKVCPFIQCLTARTQSITGATSFLFL